MLPTLLRVSRAPIGLRDAGDVALPSAWLAYPPGTVASQRAKRQSRKRRTPGRQPQAPSSPRPEQPAQRDVVAAGQSARTERQLGTEGQRPAGPFGGLPVSELAILVGLVALVIWLIRGGTATLIVGLVVCTLGVLEFTAREHFSGYRSHTTLLAAIPAIAVSIGLVSAIGTRTDRAPLLMVVAAPIFSVLFWVLRKRFLAARQARIVRPPTP